MTAYLERLVSSARSSQPAIHPVLRPIYAGPARFEGTASLALQPTTQAGPASKTQEPQGPKAAPKFAPAQQTSAKSAMIPAVPAAETAQPRLRESEDPWPARSARTLSAEGERRPAAGPEPRAKSREDHLPKVRAAPAEGLFERSAVALPADPAGRQIPAPAFDGIFSEPPPLVAITERAANARSARSPEGDDIQIHIGRIEVTAVASAPPQMAPAKTVRRAQSLDDYLRRRNGGAS